MGEFAHMRRSRAGVIVLIAVLLLSGVRWLFPERPMAYTGARAILDSVFALGLLAFVLLLAGSLGWKVLGWLRLKALAPLERAVFGLALGLGILAYGVLTLGLVGLLRPWTLCLWLLGVGLWTWREWSDFVGRIPGRLARQFRQSSDLAWWKKVVSVCGGLILGLSLLHSLTPPWDYDALMYHLQAPRLFLEEGRLLLLPDTWQANGPFSMEMLYAVGLAWGTDTFAKLLHLACAVFLALATFSFGRRYLGRVEAWLAVVLLLGMPILPTWAATANTDMAWALYEFLALYALMLWRDKHETRFLLLAALMMGWALGSKYLALGGLGVLGLWILCQGRHTGWQKALVNAVTFGAIALLLALPWYAKNWLWGGNPFYPFLFGGVDWGAERLGYLMAFLRSFGVGHRLVDYLLLPWNLYTQNARFGTLRAAFEIPGLLLPLAILYPFGQRRPVMNAVAVMTFLRFLVWALGSQQTRFLLPILPSLALLGAVAIVSLTRRFQTRWRGTRALPFIVGSSALVATLLFQATMFGAFLPTAVLTGQQSKSEFIRQRLVNHQALEAVQEALTREQRALMIWDGVSYYCDERCIADAEQSKWTQLVQTAPSPTSAAQRLRASQVTHLLYNQREAEFMAQRDATGLHRQAAEFFLQDFLPACTEVIYRDENMILAEITCP